MKNTFLYIDVPYGYEYRWKDWPAPITVTSAEVLAKQENFIKATFVANAIARISQGDVYKVYMTEQEAMIFCLAGKFDIVPAYIVDEFLAQDSIRRILTATNFAT